MRITLTRTGGIIPVTKQAQTDVDMNEDELKKLVNSIKSEEDSAEAMRDNTSYTLSYDAESFAVDLEKLPAKYKTTFDELKDNLRIVKPS